jgi:hypothetical protein
VVGFTAGQPGADGTFTVTGADAHVWPQVYLGPDAGWVSVEPTPPSVAGSPAAEGVVGAAEAAGSRATGSTSTTAVGQTSTAGSSPGGARRSPGAHRSGRRDHTHGSGSAFAWWTLAVVVAGLLVLGSLAVWAVRRRRVAREAALPPDARVVGAWERALVALRRQGLARRPDETPAEYAARVRGTGDAAAGSVEADAVAHLAGLVELACYRSRPCTPAQAGQAHALASTIVAAHRPRRRRRRQHRSPPGARVGG